MAHSPTTLRTIHGIQKSLFTPEPTRVLAGGPKGVVYTKPWVVELLLDLAGYSSSKNLVDAVAVEPASGDGAFLGPMIVRLIGSCIAQKRPLTDCAQSLAAYELHVAAADRARALASGLLRENGVDLSTAETLVKSWVRTADYLLDVGTFQSDFVIGNPPYVRLEDIPEETAALYRYQYSTMRGRADLYIAFFEAALSQLKPGGVCAFICADRWMRNQYGADLRALITSAYNVEVVLEMHDADAFHDEVDAYPAITVIRHDRQGPAVVASAGPTAVLAKPSELAAALDATKRGKSGKASVGLASALVEKWFKGSDPWPCNSPEQLSMLRRLEDAFVPLEATAKVGIGVATGNDNVFITKDAELVEKSRLLKLALAQDIGSGTMEWSGHYLVDPWNAKGLVDLDEYPRLKKYFDEHAAGLKKRHTALKNRSGWYKTIDRVTHSLAAKPKLYIADIKNVLAPVLDLGQTYPHHNLYFIESETWDLEVLGGLLMSAVGQFFVSSYGVRMRGGYWRFQAQYLRRIRLPDPQTISDLQSRELIAAFRIRDRSCATATALQLYGIKRSEWETAIGLR